jgi:hypothetical protein
LNVSPRFFQHTPKTPIFARSSLLFFASQNAAFPRCPQSSQKCSLQPPRNAVENVLQPPKHSTRSKQTPSGFAAFQTHVKAACLRGFLRPRTAFTPAATEYSDKKFHFFENNLE